MEVKDQGAVFVVEKMLAWSHKYLVSFKHSVQGHLAFKAWLQTLLCESSHLGRADCACKAVINAHVFESKHAPSLTLAHRYRADTANAAHVA